MPRCNKLWWSNARHGTPAQQIPANAIAFFSLSDSHLRAFAFQQLSLADLLQVPNTENKRIFCFVVDVANAVMFTAIGVLRTYGNADLNIYQISSHLDAMVTTSLVRQVRSLAGPRGPLTRLCRVA